MKYIMWLKDVTLKDINIVGGKAAHLGELASIQMPVPPAFFVRMLAFEDYLIYNDYFTVIKKILSKIDINNYKQVKFASYKILKIILNGNLPIAIKTDVIEAYEKLIKEVEESHYVAVRSSMTFEDTSSRSYAGQAESYLNIHNINSLLNSIKKCWASLYNPRMLSYSDIFCEKEKISMAVIVQKMIHATASGIMFTINPFTFNDNNIFIESNWGLGISVVQGLTNPDMFVIEKKTLDIIIKKLGRKNLMIIESVEGYIKKKTPINKAKKISLTKVQIKKLAKFGLNIEKHFNEPQNIEWAIRNNNIYILQTRPVIGLKSRQISNN